jgi:hypothetical protein
MNEIWKRMIYNGKDYGDYYLVSNTGKIKNTRTGLIRKETLHPNGYYLVSVSFGARELKYTIKVHRVVAETFIPRVDGKEYVNHIDCNKRNNNVENLEWCTLSENTQHASEHGLLKQRMVSIKCIETGDIFNSIKDAALWCGCKRGNINDYLYRKDKQRRYAGKHPITNQKLHWCII